MIKLKDILTEAKNSIYYDFQIKISQRSGDDPYFIHRDGMIQKHTTSVDGNPLVFDYRNALTMAKAALKIKTNKSEIVIWDEKGKGKAYPFTVQAIKRIIK